MTFPGFAAAERAYENRTDDHHEEEADPDDARRRELIAQGMGSVAPDSWPEIRPEAESYYNLTAEQAIIIAEETVDEWDYDRDKHGYCHERPVLVALLAEIEALKARVR